MVPSEDQIRAFIHDLTQFFLSTFWAVVRAVVFVAITTLRTLKITKGPVNTKESSSNNSALSQPLPLPDCPAGREASTSDSRAHSSIEDEDLTSDDSIPSRSSLYVRFERQSLRKKKTILDLNDSDDQDESEMEEAIISPCCGIIIDTVVVCVISVVLMFAVYLLVF